MAKISMNTRIENFLNIVSTIFKKSWWIIPIASTSLVFLAFYLGWIPVKGTSLEEKGQFGDSFGVLNSLFTGLGFGGVVVTLILQQRQLSQQEAEIKIQRQSEEKRHYEETLHGLLGLYSKTIDELSAPKGDLKSRAVLNGSIFRAMSAIKSEQVNMIPQAIQRRYEKKKLKDEDQRLLDYLYFRNFKILTVELDRQARLIETFIVLLEHLVNGKPPHLLLKNYSDLVCSQLTYVEIKYFFLIALAFSKESKLRELIVDSNIVYKIAHVSRLQVHDYMYNEFWGVNVSLYKEIHSVPISQGRIKEALRAYKKYHDEVKIKTEGSTSAPVKISYTSSRVIHMKVDKH